MFKTNQDSRRKSSSAPGGGVACVWGAATDVGKLRSRNEDSCFANGQLFAVADGLGGYEGGHIASKLAVSVLKRESQQRSLPLGADPRLWLSDDAVARKLADHSPGVFYLYRCFQQANQEIRDASESEIQLASMGTTLSAIQLYNDAGTEGAAAESAASGERPYFAIANVGDSRIYHFSKQKLRQISVDHTFVNELVKQGIISAAEAETHQRRNELTRCLGPFPAGAPYELEVDVWEIPAVAGDRFLLCSDGLTIELPDKAIAKILKSQSDPRQATASLMQAALDAGGRDNVTVAVVDVVDAAQLPAGQ